MFNVPRSVLRGERSGFCGLLVALPLLELKDAAKISKWEGDGGS